MLGNVDGFLRIQAGRVQPRSSTGMCRAPQWVCRQGASVLCSRPGARNPRLRLCPGSGRDSASSSSKHRGCSAIQGTERRLLKGTEAHCENAWRARTPRGAHASPLSCSRPDRGRGRQMKKRPRQAAGGASEAARPGDKRPPCQLPSCYRGQPAKPRSEGPPLKSDGPGKGLLIPEPAIALWARRGALFRGHTCAAG